MRFRNGVPDAEEQGEPKYLSWIDTFSIALATVAGIALLGMMCNIVGEVLARTVSRPPPGTVDLTQFAWMPMIISLGLGYALLQGQHLQVTLLTDAASGRAQRLIEVFSQFFVLLTAGGLAWFSSERALAASLIGEAPTSTPWLPIWLFRWVLVFGVIGLVLQAFAQLRRAIGAAPVSGPAPVTGPGVEAPEQQSGLSPAQGVDHRDGNMRAGGV